MGDGFGPNRALDTKGSGHRQPAAMVVVHPYLCCRLTSPMSRRPGGPKRGSGAPTAGPVELPALALGGDGPHPALGRQHLPADRAAAAAGCGRSGRRRPARHRRAVSSSLATSTTRSRPPSRARTVSPTLTVAAGLARTPLIRTCPARHTCAARDRVFTSRTDHRERSILVPSIPPMMARAGGQRRRAGRVGAEARPGRPAARTARVQSHGGSSFRRPGSCSQQLSLQAPGSGRRCWSTERALSSWMGLGRAPDVRVQVRCRRPRTILRQPLALPRRPLRLQR
jgi:hypothetical protein